MTCGEATGTRCHCTYQVGKLCTALILHSRQDAFPFSFIRPWGWRSLDRIELPIPRWHFYLPSDEVVSQPRHDKLHLLSLPQVGTLWKSFNEAGFQGIGLTMLMAGRGKVLLFRHPYSGLVATPLNLTYPNH